MSSFRPIDIGGCRLGRCAGIAGASGGWSAAPAGWGRRSAAGPGRFRKGRCSGAKACAFVTEAW